MLDSKIKLRMALGVELGGICKAVMMRMIKQQMRDANKPREKTGFKK